MNSALIQTRSIIFRQRVFKISISIENKKIPKKKKGRSLTFM